MGSTSTGNYEEMLRTKYGVFSYLVGVGCWQHPADQVEELLEELLGSWLEAVSESLLEEELESSLGAVLESS